MELTKNEAFSYSIIKEVIIPSFTVGNTYYAMDFFGSSPSVPRIMRKLFEDVKANKIPNLKLAGKRSSDGYLRI